MPVQLSPDMSKKIQEFVDSDRFSDETDVIEQALGLLDIRERKLERLRAGLVIGEMQEQHGDMFELTLERVAKIKRDARLNAQSQAS